jgi:hypothetical protein
MNVPPFVSFTTLYASQLNALVNGIPSLTSQLVNDAGFITLAPVLSVNGQTGAVTINAGLASVSLTGAVTGISSAGTIPTTLAASGVTAGTYNSVVVNSSGLVTSASYTAQPYDIIMSYIGIPAGGQQLYRAIIPRNVTLAASLLGSYIQCNITPKNNWTAIISVNGSIVGSATIPAYSISGSFSFATTVVIAAGSMLEVNAPAIADVLTDPSITIVGTR